MDITREQVITDFKKDMGVKESYTLTDDENYFVDKLVEALQELKESDSLQPVSEAVCDGSVSVGIVDSDIATIEALHDLLLDAHGYSLDFIALKRARELTAKMYKAVK